MKKFYVRDADGEEYEVEEINECHDDEIAEATETALTADEIAALKRLAGVADKILATLETSDETTQDPDETLKDEDVEEEEKMEDEEKTEEVIETKTRDSRRSFGAIEKRKAVVDDSLNTDIDDAWAKRYGGRN